MKIDFTNCQTEPLKMYGGANGSKICVKHNGEDYMLKFPPKDNMKTGYKNSCISEHIK